MKRLSLLVALVATFALSTVALAAPDRTYAPGQNKILCEASGEATANAKGAKGCELSVGPGGAAFAYYYPAVAWDKTLGSIDALSFAYSGDAPTGGSPRFSLQIDEDGAGPLAPTDYAFVDALGCNNGSGLVDVINDPTCSVDYKGITYPNWAAFVTAYPDATLYFAFVIVDQPGDYTINNVTIGKPGAKK